GDESPLPQTGWRRPPTRRWDYRNALMRARIRARITRKTSLRPEANPAGDGAAPDGGAEIAARAGTNPITRPSTLISSVPIRSPALIGRASPATGPSRAAGLHSDSTRIQPQQRIPILQVARRPRWSGHVPELGSNDSGEQRPGVGRTCQSHQIAGRGVAGVVQA